MRDLGKWCTLMLVGLFAVWWVDIEVWHTHLTINEPKCDTIYIGHPDPRRLGRVINTCYPGDTVVMKRGTKRTDHFERLMARRDSILHTHHARN
jgi:hypothetical protein